MDNEPERIRTEEEVVCPECKGKGKVLVDVVVFTREENSRVRAWYQENECNYCLGEGTVFYVYYRLPKKGSEID